MESKVIFILYFLLLQVMAGGTNAAKNQKKSPEKVKPLQFISQESKIYHSQQPGKILMKDSDHNSSSMSRIKRQYIYGDRYYPLPIFVGGGFGYRGFGGRGFGVRGFGGRAFGGRGFGGGFGGRGFGGRGVSGRGFGSRGIGGRGIGGRGIGGRGIGGRGIGGRGIGGRGGGRGGRG